MTRLEHLGRLRGGGAAGKSLDLPITGAAMQEMGQDRGQSQRRGLAPQSTEEVWTGTLKWDNPLKVGEDIG